MAALFDELNGGLFVSRGQGIHPVRKIDSFEIIFVVSGQLGIFEENTNFIVNQNERLLLFPGRRHGGTIDYSPDLSFFWVHFRCGSEGLAVINKLQQYDGIARPEKLTNWFRLLLDEQELSKPNKTQLDLIMNLIVIECGLVKEPGANVLLALATETRNYIKLSFATDISTSMIADELGCNPDYLGQIFKQCFRRTISEELNQVRIKHAEKLLLTTKKHINEIIHESGFNDAAYFRRRFRRYFKMTPGQYRKLHAGYHLNTE